MSKPTDPWTYARAAERAYLTPEDIADAAEQISRDPEAGHAELDELWHCVLTAIGRKIVEDWSLCAFVAAKAIVKVPARWYA